MPRKFYIYENENGDEIVIPFKSKSLFLSCIGYYQDGKRYLYKDRDKSLIKKRAKKDLISTFDKRN